MEYFNKILIANRGEIAVRIIKAAKSLSIKTVAIYSEVDINSLHKDLADEAFSIGEFELSQTYLNIPKIIEIAKNTNCDAIHPGYGFLSENPEFIIACNKANIVFIGPNENAIKLMGNKIAARESVAKIGTPMTKAITGSVENLMKAADEIPFPLLVKAAAGGGGKGMKIVKEKSELKNTLKSTSREAKSYFGDESIFVEQFIENPRHIEIQVLGDKFGNVIHLYERECSIQRRYQKIIEESPSPTLNDEIREKMGVEAVKIAKSINYDSAGTIEFLVDEDLNFYFLEMNTRIQVEHPITEIVTGIDLVIEQIKIAAGERLKINQSDVRQNGHAIEARIYAEDAENNFSPSPGDISYYYQAESDNIRIDSGIDKATTIHSFFDPMISKVIAFGENRNQARLLLVKSLENHAIHGIKTNTNFLIAILNSNVFIENKISTKFCDLNTQLIFKDINSKKAAIKHKEFLIAYALFSFRINQESKNVWDKIGFWRINKVLSINFNNKNYSLKINKKTENEFQIKIENDLFEIKILNIENNSIELLINKLKRKFHISTTSDNKHIISEKEFNFYISRNDELIEEDFFKSEGNDENENLIHSPMPGKVIEIAVKKGDKVKKGDTLLIVEAMKMENSIKSKVDSIVGKINIKEGDIVGTADILIELSE
jgi:acetyl-CoA carboxylase biotin carboxylase subunit